LNILTWGDLHGQDIWKKTDVDRYDKIIFLGDYVDSLYLDDQTIIRTFTEVIDFKKQYPDKVVLLIGNHEINYLFPKYCPLGYRVSKVENFLTIFLKNFDYFRIAFQYRNYLWTHAGIHKGWYHYKLKEKVEETDRNLADTLERLFIERYPPLFEVGWARGGTQYDVGGPFWLDASLLIKKPLAGLHQIVGHTHVKTIKHYKPYPKDPETTVTLCNCVERGDGSSYELFLDEIEEQ